MKPYRILLADDHKIVRMAMRLLIEEIPGLVVVGEADDGRQAVEMVDHLQPDLAIVDNYNEYRVPEIRFLGCQPNEIRQSIIGIGKCGTSFIARELRMRL